MLPVETLLEVLHLRRTAQAHVLQFRTEAIFGEGLGLFPLGTGGGLGIFRARIRRQDFRIPGRIVPAGGMGVAGLLPVAVQRIGGIVLTGMAGMLVMTLLRCLLRFVIEWVWTPELMIEPGAIWVMSVGH
jgi:hypothetical protein